MLSKIVCLLVLAGSAYACSNNCMVHPCTVNSCPKYPGAYCRPDFCTCTAEFYVNGVVVNDCALPTSCADMATVASCSQKGGCIWNGSVCVEGNDSVSTIQICAGKSESACHLDKYCRWQWPNCLEATRRETDTAIINEQIAQSNNPVTQPSTPTQTTTPSTPTQTTTPTPTQTTSPSNPVTQPSTPTQTTTPSTPTQTTTTPTQSTTTPEEQNPTAPNPELPADVEEYEAVAPESVIPPGKTDAHSTELRRITPAQDLYELDRETQAALFEFLSEGDLAVKTVLDIVALGEPDVLNLNSWLLTCLDMKRNKCFTSEFCSPVKNLCLPDVSKYCFFLGNKGSCGGLLCTNNDGVCQPRLCGLLEGPLIHLCNLVPGCKRDGSDCVADPILPYDGFQCQRRSLHDCCEPYCSISCPKNDNKCYCEPVLNSLTTGCQFTSKHACLQVEGCIWEKGACLVDNLIENQGVCNWEKDACKENLACKYKGDECISRFDKPFTEPCSVPIDICNRFPGCHVVGTECQINPNVANFCTGFPEDLCNSRPVNEYCHYDVAACECVEGKPVPCISFIGNRAGCEGNVYPSCKWTPVPFISGICQELFVGEANICTGLCKDACLSIPDQCTFKKGSCVRNGEITAMICEARKEEADCATTRDCFWEGHKCLSQLAYNAKCAGRNSIECLRTNNCKLKNNVCVDDPDAKAGCVGRSDATCELNPNCKLVAQGCLEKDVAYTICNGIPEEFCGGTTTCSATSVCTWNADNNRCETVLSQIVSIPQSYNFVPLMSTDSAVVGESICGIQLEKDACITSQRCNWIENVGRCVDDAHFIEAEGCELEDRFACDENKVDNCYWRENMEGGQCSQLNIFDAAFQSDPEMLDVAQKIQLILDELAARQVEFKGGKGSCGIECTDVIDALLDDFKNLKGVIDVADATVARWTAAASQQAANIASQAANAAAANAELNGDLKALEKASLLQEKAALLHEKAAHDALQVTLTGALAHLQTTQGIFGKKLTTEEEILRFGYLTHARIQCSSFRSTQCTRYKYQCVWNAQTKLCYDRGSAAAASASECELYDRTTCLIHNNNCQWRPSKDPSSRGLGDCVHGSEYFEDSEICPEMNNIVGCTEAGYACLWSQQINHCLPRTPIPASKAKRITVSNQYLIPAPCRSQIRIDFLLEGTVEKAAIYTEMDYLRKADLQFRARAAAFFLEHYGADFATSDYTQGLQLVSFKLSDRLFAQVLDFNLFLPDVIIPTRNRILIDGYQVFNRDKHQGILSGNYAKTLGVKSGFLAPNEHLIYMEFRIVDDYGGIYHQFGIATMYPQERTDILGVMPAVSVVRHFDWGTGVIRSVEKSVALDKKSKIRLSGVIFFGECSTVNEIYKKTVDAIDYAATEAKLLALSAQSLGLRASPVVGFDGVAQVTKGAAPPMPVQNPSQSPVQIPNQAPQQTQFQVPQQLQAQFQNQNPQNRYGL